MLNCPGAGWRQVNYLGSSRLESTVWGEKEGERGWGPPVRDTWSAGSGKPGWWLCAQGARRMHILGWVWLWSWHVCLWVYAPQLKSHVFPHHPLSTSLPAIHWKSVKNLWTSPEYLFKCKSLFLTSKCFLNIQRRELFGILWLRRYLIRSYTLRTFIYMIMYFVGIILVCSYIRFKQYRPKQGRLTFPDTSQGLLLMNEGSVPMAEGASRPKCPGRPTFWAGHRSLFLVSCHLACCLTSHGHKEIIILSVLG